MEHSSSLTYKKNGSGRQLQMHPDVRSNTPNYRQIFEGQSDEEVWQAYRAGRDDAFSYIYDTYFDSLYYCGCQLCPDTHRVVDLLQDFFLELRLKKPKTDAVLCIKAYLLKSFRRKVIKFLKKDQWLIFNKEVTEGSFTISFHHEMQFMKTQFHEQQQKHIEKMLNQLTPREREAIYYFYFENLSYNNVSAVMGLSSAKAARNLIYKGLSILRKNRHQFPQWLQYCLMLATI
ncbi:MAG: sigma-70 family RNA polymerase sigma factor [Cyclobacteriaceae bacterium]